MRAVDTSGVSVKEVEEEVSGVFFRDEFEVGWSCEVRPEWLLGGFRDEVVLLRLCRRKDVDLGASGHVVSSFAMRVFILERGV